MSYFKIIYKQIKSLFFKKEDYCMFYILSLLRKDRYQYTYKNLSLYDSFDLIQSVNGYSEKETLEALVETGLKFNNLHDANSLRYGVLANFLTKYKMLEYQIEHEIPYICFIEDDVIIKKDFVNYIYGRVLRLFKKNKNLNIVRLGTWGEGYVTSLKSAKRIVKLIKKRGICENIDNQLRKYCGPEKDISQQCFEKIYHLASAPNSGDCLNTDFIDLSKIDSFSLKNADVKNYSKYQDKNLMFFSQNGTDKYLQENVFKGMEDKFFVDIGATNGVNSNNTLTLERCFGWTGLLIEPSLEFESLFTNRFNSANNVLRSQFLSDETGKDISFGHCKTSCFASDSKMLNDNESGEFHSYKLNSITFTDLFLSDFSIEKTIDFMSISSNGHELEILNGIDFGLLHIRCLLVKSDDDKALSELLHSKNFIKINKISRYWLFIHYDSLKFFKIDDINLPKWENQW
jgi:hypothetical protein